MGTETGLKYILKHVNRFYDMCQSDGTCTRMLPDVMKYRGDIFSLKEVTV